MRYEEPKPRPRHELEAELAAATGDVVAAALIDASQYESADWVVERLLLASGDDRREVVIAALTGFAALARRGELRTDRRIWRVLLRATDESEFAGVAEDTIDDLELYGMLGHRRSRRGSTGSDG